MKFDRYLSQQDAAALSRLAEQLLREREVKYNAGEQLIDIISTAILIPENAPRRDCVALNSQVIYSRLDSEERHAITVVCPQDANQALARVSVLAPLAMALIGKQAGSIVDVELPFSQVMLVRIVEVIHLADAALAQESVAG